MLIPEQLSLAIIASFPIIDAVHLAVSEQADAPVEQLTCVDDGVGGYIATFRFIGISRSRSFSVHVSAEGALRYHIDPPTNGDKRHV